MRSSLLLMDHEIWSERIGYASSSLGCMNSGWNLKLESLFPLIIGTKK